MSAPAATPPYSPASRPPLGDGWAFYLVQFSTVVLLALAANTSYGGLPVLASLLARDNVLPHVFALRADRQVYRYGVVVLTVLAGILLVGADGQVNALVPLFAIGVFIGFTLSQIGMVRHWREERPRGWIGKAVLNASGALLTGVAAVVIIVSKFLEGAWVVAVLLALLMLLFGRIRRAYDRIGARLGIGELPPRPEAHERVVIVPVRGVDRLTAQTLGAARSLASDVRAVHVCDLDDPSAAENLRQRWEEWDPGVPLVLLPGCEQRRLETPVLDYLDGLREDVDPALLIGEVEPTHWWARALQNQRGAVLARAVRHRRNTVVCRLRFPVE